MPSLADRLRIRPADLGWLISAASLLAVGWLAVDPPFVPPVLPIETPIDADRFHRAVIMPAKPPVVDPPHVAAADSDVRPEELVLGIEIAGEARAYPCNMLSGPIREILNDSLGGEPIAVTWCDFCHDAIAYERRLDGRVLTLFVDGSMWEQSMLIRDLPTDSLWSQVLGKCLQGELAGRVLEVVPAVQTTWSDWKSRHPATTVVQFPRERNDFTRRFHRDRRRFVLGVRIGAESASISFAALAVRRLLDVEVGGEPLVVTYDDEHSAPRVFSRRIDQRTLDFTPGRTMQMRDRQTESIWDAGSGRCLTGRLAGRLLSPRPGIVAYASVWRRFHPDNRDLDAAP